MLKRPLRSMPHATALALLGLALAACEADKKPLAPLPDYEPPPPTTPRDAGPDPDAGPEADAALGPLTEPVWGDVAVFPARAVTRVAWLRGAAVFYGDVPESGDWSALLDVRRIRLDFQADRMHGVMALGGSMWLVVAGDADAPVVVYDLAEDNPQPVVLEVKPPIHVAGRREEILVVGRTFTNAPPTPTSTEEGNEVAQFVDAALPDGGVADAGTAVDAGSDADAGASMDAGSGDGDDGIQRVAWQLVDAAGAKPIVVEAWGLAPTTHVTAGLGVWVTGHEDGGCVVLDSAARLVAAWSCGVRGEDVLLGSGDSGSNEDVLLRLGVDATDRLVAARAMPGAVTALEGASGEARAALAESIVQNGEALTVPVEEEVIIPIATLGGAPAQTTPDAGVAVVDAAAAADGGPATDAGADGGTQPEAATTGFAVRVGFDTWAQIPTTDETIGWIAGRATGPTQHPSLRVEWDAAGERLALIEVSPTPGEEALPTLPSDRASCAEGRKLWPEDCFIPADRVGDFPEFPDRDCDGQSEGGLCCNEATATPTYLTEEGLSGGLESSLHLFPGDLRPRVAYAVADRGRVVYPDGVAGGVEGFDAVDDEDGCALQAGDIQANGIVGGCREAVISLGALELVVGEGDEAVRAVADVSGDGQIEVGDQLFEIRSSVVDTDLWRLDVGGATVPFTFNFRGTATNAGGTWGEFDSDRVRNELGHGGVRSYAVTDGQLNRFPDGEDPSPPQINLIAVTRLEADAARVGFAYDRENGNIRLSGSDIAVGATIYVALADITQLTLLRKMQGAINRRPVELAGWDGIDAVTRVVSEADEAILFATRSVDGAEVVLLPDRTDVPPIVGPCDRSLDAWMSRDGGVLMVFCPDGVFSVTRDRLLGALPDWGAEAPYPDGARAFWVQHARSADPGRTLDPVLAWVGAEGGERRLAWWGINAAGSLVADPTAELASPPDDLLAASGPDIERTIQPPVATGGPYARTNTDGRVEVWEAGEGWVPRPSSYGPESVRLFDDVPLAITVGRVPSQDGASISLRWFLHDLRIDADAWGRLLASRTAISLGGSRGAAIGRHDGGYGAVFARTGVDGFLLEYFPLTCQ